MDRGCWGGRQSYSRTLATVRGRAAERQIVGADAEIVARCARTRCEARKCQPQSLRCVSADFDHDLSDGERPTFEVAAPLLHLCRKGPRREEVAGERKRGGG